MCLNTDSQDDDQVISVEPCDNTTRRWWTTS